MSNPDQLTPLQQALFGLKTLRARLEAIEAAKREPIAIIGVGCRFPGATGRDAFWRLLHDGVDAITEVPPGRWNIDAYYDPDPDKPGKIATRYGGFLNHIDQFDAGFFGIAPREALSLDPQQRLLLEVAWEALEDGGQAPEKLSGTATGVFVGISSFDYSLLMGGEGVDAYFGTGNALSAAAGRLSYVLGAQGPSMSMDTACSSSLVAVHLACQSLRNGESTMALAGGVGLLLSPIPHMTFSRARMLAPDGRCKTFDAAANGYVRSEGCGVVVLKRLSDAQAAGDRILAVIRASAVNQDGPSGGLTVPNGRAQEALIRQALASGEVEPQQVGYIEAHGTGTALGDPIEIRALLATLGTDRPADRPLLVGSVKTNIGHLEAAAGIAGLIKVVLALEHEEIPPHLHFQQPNPYIEWSEALKVPTAPLAWPAGGERRLAGVSSFGFTGTNAHVILEEAPAVETAAGTDRSRLRPVYLLALSAKSETAVKELAERFNGHLESHPQEAFTDVCFTATTGRSHWAHRVAIVAADREEARRRLAGFVEGTGPESIEGVVRGKADLAMPAKVAFLFTGQGAQYARMGRQLYETEPVFRRTLEQCDEILRPQLTPSLLSVIYAEPGAEGLLDETAYTQPALFAFEYALAELWRSWGVEPDAVMGHSVGEYVAACVAGVFRLEDGLRLIARRAELMQSLPRGGRMAAVFAPHQRVAAAMDRYADRVAIAAVNGPEHFVLSGQGEAVEAIVEELTAEDIHTQWLTVSHAFHSPLMDPILERFEQTAATITYARPRLRLVSNRTGRVFKGDERPVAGYWRQHLREAVQFAAGMEALEQQGCDTFVEIGPHPTLIGMGRRCITPGQGTWVPSMRRGREDCTQMLESLAALYVRGVAIDWNAFHGNQPHRKLSLPTYPFQRERFWGTRGQTPRPLFAGEHPLLGHRLNTAEPTWEQTLDTRGLTYLNDHRLDGRTVLPASASVEMAIAAGGQLSGAKRFMLEDVHFSKVFILPAGETRTTQTVLDPVAGIFSVYSKPTDSDTSWTAHVRGSVRIQETDNSIQTPVDVEKICARCTRAISGLDLYTSFAAAGMEYGPAFQGVHRLWLGKDEALAEIQPPEGLESEHYLLHPALLDACFHVAAGLAKDTAAYLPVEIQRVRVHKALATARWSYAVLKELTAGNLVADVRVFDATGSPLIDVEGLRCRAVEAAAHADRNLNRLVYEFEWLPQTLPGVVGGLDPGLIALKTNVAAGGYGGELEWTSSYERLEPEIDRLCSAFIAGAFRELGGQLETGRRFSTEQFAAQIGIAKRYRDLLNRYLEILTTDGCMRWRGSEWEVVASPAFEDPLAIWRDLSARNPAFFGELTLLGRCGGKLAPILRGELDPLQVIFPNGSMALAEHLYQSSPSLRFYNILVRRAVEAAVEALPPGFPIRLLEVGAGTGGLTANVLPALPATTSAYVFTDVSAHFFAKAQEKFHAYGFVEYRRLDIESDPVSQGLQANSFDIILASEALHATADLRRTLGNVRQLLAPGGLLVLLEAVKPTRWIDLVFGLTEGWWRFTDRDLRPAYPLLALDRWRTLLEETGFSNIAEASGRPETEVENAVIMGMRGAAPPALLPSKGTVGAAPTSPFVVFADQGGVGQRVVDVLRARGYRCNVVPAGSREPIFNAVGGILHFWNLDCNDAAAAQIEGCLSVVQAVRALSKTRQSASPRLWIITRNAQHAEDSDPAPSLFQAPVWGLARVAGNEVAEHRPTLVDLSTDATDQEIQSLVNEILADGPETEIALRRNVRYVHRYVRAPEAGRRTIRMDEAPFSLDVSAATLVEHREVGPGHIELRVIAAELNAAESAPVLGCAGRVTRVGAGVEHLQTGDEVIALAAHLGNLVVTPAAYVVPKPRRLNFAEAATIPSAFLSAAYALRHVGRLAAGERVLVHCAANDLALAAIQLARKAGAVIFATADTRETRDYLRDIGVEHVLDSTSPAWADELSAANHGRGVDVILNSHSGEMTAHAGILSEYGRFLHIAGPSDSNGGRTIATALRRNQSFYAIDFESVCRERSDILSPRLLELMREISEGTLQPLPHRVFPVSDAASAFQNAARTDQIGTVVIGFEEQEAAVALQPKSAPLFGADATYLISGGFGGFGLKVARWMVDAGARHLVLLGRHGDDAPQAHQAVMELRQLGAEVIAAKGDVARADDVMQLVSSIDRSMPPLRGIVHAAMVLQDCRLTDLDEARMQEVCAPKINGAWNLHTATTNRALDFFVMFSSMSSVFGIPGQGSYAAANSFLDSFAHYRRTLGLPAVTINWGYLGEVGWVARQSAVRARLEAQGIRSFSPAEALAVLERVLRKECAQAGVIRIAWPHWAKAIGSAAVPLRFADLAKETTLEDASTQRHAPRLDRRTLLATAPTERRTKIEEYVREQVGQVLGLAPSKVDIQQPVGQLGLDSLMAVELRNRVEKDLGITLPAVTLLEEPSVASLAAELLVRLEGTAVSSPERQADAAGLSASQRWLWRLHETNRINAWRHFVMSIRIGGALNVAALERSIDEIVRRHAALRAGIVQIDEQPSPLVMPHEELKLALTDLSQLAESEREARIRLLAAEESTKPFEYERGRLIRVVLLRFGPEEHILLVTAHPLAFDESSVEVFLRELASLYPAFAESRSAPVGAPAFQYADYAIQEQHWLKSEPFERQLTYWKKLLASPPPMLEFPADHPRSANQLYQPAFASIDLTAELSRSMRELAHNEGSTLPMVMLAAFETVLYRYTSQADFAIGCFTPGRSEPELRGLIGQFVNYLVFRADMSGDPGFRLLLTRVREASLAMQNNQDVPFDVLLEALQIKPDLSHTPLFQAAFAFDPVPAALSLPALRTNTSILSLGHVHSNFDLTLRINDATDHFAVAMQYNSALFEAATIQRLLQTFQTLLEGIVANPDQSVSGLPLMSSAERRKLVLGDRKETSAEELESVALQKLRRSRRKS